MRACLTKITSKYVLECSRIFFFQVEFYFNEDAFLLTANVAMVSRTLRDFFEVFETRRRFAYTVCQAACFCLHKSIDDVYFRYSDTGICNTVNIAN